MLTADVSHRSASGQVLSSATWLDDHFEACRHEYEEMLRSAGLRPGWAVLDVGCGTGSFLPLIQSEVGWGGRVVAIDGDAHNIAILGQRLDTAASEPLVGSVLSLPFATEAFDAVWCANVTQYLDDEAVVHVLDEMIRVVRPGGLIAVKDVDMAGLRIYPADPFLGARLAEACITTEPVTTESRGSLRGRELRRWLERAGLEDVSQRTFAIEYWSPLSEAATRLWSSWLPYLAQLAEEHHVPEPDAEVWRQVSTPEAAATFVSTPDFYACELQVLAIGRTLGTPQRDEHRHPTWGLAATTEAVSQRCGRRNADRTRIRGRQHHRRRASQAQIPGHCHRSGWPWVASTRAA